MISFRKLTDADLFFLKKVRDNYCENFLHESKKFTLEETKIWFYEKNPDYYIILLNEEKIGYFRLSNYSEINKNIYINTILFLIEYKS